MTYHKYRNYDKFVFSLAPRCPAGIALAMALVLHVNITSKLGLIRTTTVSCSIFGPALELFNIFNLIEHSQTREEKNARKETRRIGHIYRLVYLSFKF